MSLRGRLFASIYDRFTAGAEAAGLRALRQQLLANARGRVLEIGAGTGATCRSTAPMSSSHLLSPKSRWRNGWHSGCASSVPVLNWWRRQPSGCRSKMRDSMSW